MTIKLDMSKAYDKVEWNCLEKIMIKIGFHLDWVNTMMRCVRSVSHAIKINAKPWVQIVQPRGLGQGDPLSTYLFLICAEGLSSLLRKLVEDGLMKGVVACPRDPEISHLFFANDNLIFCQAITEDCTNLERTLETYEQVSGQHLNREKTFLFFSSNTLQDIQDDIKSRFRAEVIKQHETYLGLPSLVGKSKCNTFY